MAAPKLLAAAAALALAGCQAHNGAGGSNSLCQPFAAANAAAPTATNGAPATAGPLAAADPGAGLDDCLHRWSYALAASSDDADHVAQAALGACESALGRWNQNAAAGGAGPDAAPVEAPSLITGQPTSPIAQHLSFAQGRALFYVVQARAGHCAAPPLKDGVPVGLTRD